MANLSFSQGTFPSKFKHASVTPLLKKPGLIRSVSANFRPISNLNNISKILERLFLTRLQPQPHITPHLNLNCHTSSFGIMGSSHNWFQSYLLNRSFSVTSCSTSSSILSSSCGVPQGSVLGPILFTIYVSPFASIVSSHGVDQQQYADDTQLFLFISPASLSSSLCSLQQCVSSLHSWFLHNGLVLNPTKTEAISFGTNPRFKSLSSLTSIEVAG